MGQDVSTSVSALTCILTRAVQFNAADLALQLLDDSSLGNDMKSFRRTKQMLGQALKGSVDSEASLPFDFAHKLTQEPQSTTRHSPHHYLIMHN